MWHFVTSLSSPLLAIPCRSEKKQSERSSPSIYTQQILFCMNQM